MSITLSPNLLSAQDILGSETKVFAGTIRHTIFHSDGTIEGVAANNLLSIISKYATDFSGNKLGGYLVLSQEFWKRLYVDMLEQYAKDISLLGKNKHGGVLGIFSNFTVYEDDATDFVFLKNDSGELVYQFAVGDVHNTMKKQDVVDRFGFRVVGFDNRIPYMANSLYPYAPISVLQQWVDEDGYTPAVALLENPPEQALIQWWKQGQLSEPTKEAMPKMLEAPKND